MLVRKLVPFWIVAAAGLFTAWVWSAPAPKEKSDAKTSDQEEAVEPTETIGITAARNRVKSQNNLKQMVLAVHNYASAYNDALPKNIADKDGKPLLSWRSPSFALYREKRTIQKVQTRRALG